MSMRIRALGFACVLVVLGWGGAAQAQYALTSGSGGELQIGTGLPLPIGPPGIFVGGMTPVNGGTSCGAGPGGCSQSPDGPGTAFWPTLLVPPAATQMIAQNLSTTMGGSMMIAPGALSAPAAGAPVPIAVFPTNPAVFQVATSISYAWPAAAATFAPGGAPGIPGTTTTATTPGAGGIITFNGGTKAFGGPAQFSIVAGPGSAGGRVPPNGTGMLPVASVWINAFKKAPGSVTMVAVVGASNPTGLAQPGAPLGSPAISTMFGPIVKAIGIVNVPVPGVGCTMFCVGPLGTIPSSLSVTAAFPSNMVTASKGFPWTTGLITLSQPGAGPPEIFFQSGTDMRVAGVGNISLVSGALSLRALSGPNANRGWLSLPEPTVALGAAAALGMLGLCHGLVRRRSR